MKLSLVGLGSMGHAMAENLAGQGHELTVYNRTAARAEGLRAKGARIAATAAEAAAASEIVLSMVADDAAARGVVIGERGIAAGLAPGGIHVSCSTISPALSSELAAAHREARQGYVAAPVFGRPDAAAARQLWIVAAGAPADVERCVPVFEALGRGHSRLGEDPASANLVKLAGNFIIAAMLETLAEAYALAQKSGVSPAAFCEVFVHVFARSPIFEGYAKRIAAGAFEPAGFKATLGLKDVRLALGAAQTAAVPLPLASLVHDNLLSAVAQGMGELDWSVLARVAGARAGLG